jgi:Domain of unknown function (DUF4394)
MPVPSFLARSLPLLAAALLAACAATPEPEGPPRKETVWAVTDAAELVRFNAGQPTRLQQRLPLQGLAAGDKLVGIDFRVARGVLYGLSAQGRLYTIDTKTGRLAAVGTSAPVALQGDRFGFDFNPAADRIRVVSNTGQNLRLHPDTGALAATDPALNWAVPGAAAPQVAGAAYTYNKNNDKLTTNYAIDIASGTLLTQGSVEGVAPAVSPNTGTLMVVGAIGSMGTGAIDDAAFDIADIGNTALAALRAGGRTRLHLIDLATGRATLLGTVGEGRALWGMAIEP